MNHCGCISTYQGSLAKKEEEEKQARFQTCGRLSFSVIELRGGPNVCHVGTEDVFGTCNLYCGVRKPLFLLWYS